MRVPNWAALKEEYVAGQMSYRALATQRQVPYGALRKRAGAEGWVALRRARHACDKLDGLRRSADLITRRIGDMLEDEQQFHRHLVRYGRDGEFGVEERVMGKVDTRALKDAVSAIKGMTHVMRDLHGLLTEPERAAMEVAAARLRLDERKAGAEEGREGESGVVVLAEVEGTDGADGEG